jgi:hypothetical protein
MKFSAENRRITYSDHSETALNSAQRLVFNNWEEGFDAYVAGLPVTRNPHQDHWAHKVRRVWREGWLAAEAVDRIAAEMNSPRDYSRSHPASTTKTTNTMQPPCHTLPAS